MTEASEMVEKVARAIYEAWAKAEGCNVSWPELVDRSGRDGYPQAKRFLNLAYAEARAAIEAMREPTDAMLDASWTTCIRRPAADYIATELASPRDAHRHKTRIRHRAMIDASLHEGEAGR